MAEEQRFGNWKVVRQLGKGGQGVVYEVVEAPPREVSADLVQIRKDLTQIISAGTDESYSESTIRLLNKLREIIVPKARPPRTGALKKLHPLDDTINPATAEQRLSREVALLGEMSHPGLLNILDSNLAEKWFVTEYFGEGSLKRQPAIYRGQVLRALQALRPVIEAADLLHQKAVVHRDIKPDNLFLRTHDHLVLGDFGIAIKLEHEDRLTDLYEKAGSSDWMPPWAMSMRLDEVEPTFDVFCLSKVLWSMISGKPRLQLWYWDRPQFRLSKMFSDDTDIHWVEQLFAKTLVQEPGDCLQNAGLLLAEIDKIIRAISHGGQMPAHQGMRCRFCGIGSYSKRSDDRPPSNNLEYRYTCDNCGHLVEFIWPNRHPPKGWRHLEQ